MNTIFAFSKHKLPTRSERSELVVKREFENAMYLIPLIITVPFDSDDIGTVTLQISDTINQKVFN